MHSLWAPRTFPLRAKYNDYGSVTAVERGPLRDVWLAGFKRDLIEVGWGDNSYHDVPTSKNMTFKQLLNALWEDRVEVARDYRSIYSERLNEMMSEMNKTLARKGKKKVKLAEVNFTFEPPPGVPTLERLQGALKAKKLTLYAEGGVGGFMVDEVRYGLFRVRWNKYDKENELEKLVEAQNALSGYATMITIGSGHYKSDAEILVASKPGTEGAHLTYEDPPPKGLRIAQTMILEEVWQALLKGSIEADFGSETHTLADYRKGIQAFLAKKKADWEALRASLKTKATPEIFLMGSRSERTRAAEDFPGAWILVPSSHFMMGLDEHWELLEGMGPITDQMIDRAAEFAFIHAKLAALRYWWRPSYSMGPQHGGWPDQRKYLQSILDVAVKRARKEVEDL